MLIPILMPRSFFGGGGRNVAAPTKAEGGKLEEEVEEVLEETKFGMGPKNVKRQAEGMKEQRKKRVANVEEEEYGGNRKI